MGVAEIQIRKDGSVGQTLTSKDAGILHNNETNTDIRTVFRFLLYVYLVKNPCHTTGDQT
jgi:hypothetical protein